MEIWPCHLIPKECNAPASLLQVKKRSLFTNNQGFSKKELIKKELDEICSDRKDINFSSINMELIPIGQDMNS